MDWHHILQAGCAKEIIAQGKKPVWAHAETNEGSRNTALGAGFKPSKVNTVIHKRR